MKKIIEYNTIIVSDRDSHEMAELVNDRIKLGFQPYGFPCIAAASSDSADGDNQSDFLIMQAMVKYED
jgi:hypothetical protein